MRRHPLGTISRLQHAGPRRYSQQSAYQPVPAACIRRGAPTLPAPAIQPFAPPPAQYHSRNGRASRPSRHVHVRAEVAALLIIPVSGHVPMEFSYLSPQPSMTKTADAQLVVALVAIGWACEQLVGALFVAETTGAGRWLLVQCWAHWRK